MRLEPVPDAPALLIDGDKSWVCVADLHIGIEVQLRRAGFNVPSQTTRMLASLETEANLHPLHQVMPFEPHYPDWFTFGPHRERLALCWMGFGPLGGEYGSKAEPVEMKIHSECPDC